MYNKVVTLTEFILQEEKKVANATGQLTLLLTHIENAAKIISSHVRRSGLVDIIGEAGTKNASGDDVKKLDVFANQLLVDMLLGSGQVFAVASEELEEPLYAKDKKGEYVVFFDPLDGSSLIDTGQAIGTIFSIYRKSDTLLQSGDKQVAAGYVLYGSTTMFIYTSGNGVHGFTLDPSIGSFLLSHHKMTIPEKGKEYAINEGNMLFFDDKVKEYIATLKENGYKLRYAGAMIADIHRTMIHGGIFLYPRDKKTPNGKLRLLFEVNPMAYIVEQAGGMVFDQGENPLTIVPQSFHERAPCIVGSKTEVLMAQGVL